MTSSDYVVSRVHPVHVEIEPSLTHRNRLTTAFRLILAIPHLIIVGGPLSIALAWSASDTRNTTGNAESSGGGLLGAVAAVCAIIAWFAILFTGRHPQGLWKLCAFYLRWRVRAAAYSALFRDEYPPFGDAEYPARFEIDTSDRPRNRLTVAFRLILAIPHFIILGLLGIGWAITSVIAWFAILLTGSYPESLYRFGVGVLQWNIRVEAYVLLLHDEYPPFSLDVAVVAP
jgi:hypothetical protein